MISQKSQKMTKFSFSGKINDGNRTSCRLIWSLIITNIITVRIRLRPVLSLITKLPKTALDKSKNRYHYSNDQARSLLS